MTSVGFIQVTDAQARLEALDPRRSFIVQAPAGSGKTELLIQRYLKLLGLVQKPERILAMTFTRKAAAEMRERILVALTRGAREPHATLEPHEQLTHELALRALARGEELRWNLLDNPGRIKVQTIDSLCGSLVAQMPWLARQGALPAILEDAAALYLRAAQRTVMMVESGGRHAEWIEHLLLHLDNKTATVTGLIAAMLAKREQWIKLAVGINDTSRPVMEAILEQVVREAHDAVEQMISVPDRIAIRESYGDWETAVEGLLTKKGTWRKDFERTMPHLFARLEAANGLRENLRFLRKLPPRQFTDEQWKTLRSLLEVLKLAAAQLRIVFQEAGTVDFSEMTLAAQTALGGAEDPSELALKLDAQIEHLLIDEFQDTSQGQFGLAEALVEGWERDDGRTLFVVGDPMQSIYRFRQADVGLFLTTAEEGIGSLRPQPVVLRANYRSARSIVEWVNRVFSGAFPALNDAHAGAVRYSASEATREDIERAVQLHAFPEKDRQWEARRVVELVRQAYAEDANGSVAILVRARPQLPAIIDALKRAGLSFSAVKIDDLSARAAVRDLLALTRAMLHLGDRIGWLAILRAPWCGLSLADLHALAAGDHKALVYDLIHGDLSALSAAGGQRLLRLRGVIDEAFEDRGRRPLRMWIERTWRALGGAACLESSGDLKDANDYFELLEREQSGRDLDDFDTFASRVRELKAQPDPKANERLQIMTIHEAKGLEFDTVILPGLGRNSGMDDASLFLYHEGLMAPIQESGGEEDPVYQYLKEIEKRKSKNELVRQLYVAATRAKKRLHLLGYVSATGEPDGRSMLAVLWNGLEAEDRRLFVDAAMAAAPVEQTKPRAAPLRRLPEGWQAKPPAPPVSWNGDVEEVEAEREPTFEWVGDTLRHAGTVVHAILQRIARDPDYRAAGSAIRTSLTQLGVPALELDRAVERVESAVARTLASARGRWILEAHEQSRSEVGVAATIDGKIVRGTLDRTFIDRSGTRWVIDFKTSAHEGGGLKAFLDEQQRRYRDQLERYGKLFSGQGAPVRLGLYFPLLDEWREWGL
jgi:ATP-dependent helicase/nuclease subunit A